MRSEWVRILFFYLIFFIGFQLFAQQSYGGMPLKWKNSNLKDKELNLKEVKKNTKREGLIAVSIDQEIKADQGIWSFEDGEYIWSLAIANSKQQGIALLFDNMNLSDKARIFIYDDDHKQVLGAYTSQNQSASKRFLTPFISGDKIHIEYNGPSKDLPFKISNIYVSEDIDELKSLLVDTGYNASLECIPNFACFQDSTLFENARGICRITLALEEGIGLCTGALVNNTLGDKKPYVLSAYHCYDYFTPLFDLFRFDFLFISPECERNNTAPGFVRFIGADEKVFRRDSDMTLYQLSQAVPEQLPLYFNGWNVEDKEAPSPNYLLHHPLGDALKISLDSTEITITEQAIRWDNGTVTPAGFEYLTNLDVGSQQIGSSGGPIIGPDGLVVGQLHGGNTDSVDCEVNRAIYGRLSKSWEDSSESDLGLVTYLDPMNMGVLDLQGLENAPENSIGDSTYTLRGMVTYGNNEGVPNVKMNLAGAGEGFTFTNENGLYTFAGVPVDAQFTVTPEKVGTASEGVSSLDILLVQRIALGLDQPTNIAAQLAGDVNGSGSISGLDILQLQRVILGLDDSFLGRTPWNFIPNAIQFPLVSDNNSSNFQSFKLGDLNFSTPLD